MKLNSYIGNCIHHSLHMSEKFKKIILLINDIIILYLALYLALLIRYNALPSKQLLSNHLAWFTIIFIGWVIIFYISDLYNLHLAINNINFFQKTIQSLVINGFLSVVFFYLAPNIGITPKSNLLIFIIIFAVLFFIWRCFFNWMLRKYLPKNNIAIIGFNQQIMELINELNYKPHLGYRIVLIIDEFKKSLKYRDVEFQLQTRHNERGSIDKISHSLFNDDRIFLSDNLASLPKQIIAKKINTIVIVDDPAQLKQLRSILFNCLPLRINFIKFADFYEIITGKIPVEAINQMWFLENLNKGRRIWFDTIKRMYDIALALLILFITFLFWPIIALIIKLESNGSVFFKQSRVGQNKQIFTIIKFRTMLINNNSFSPTQKSDSRITKFGSFMRKTRIDEIPQVINILRGEMSFVGPRPERPELSVELEKNISFYNERTLIKPGLTGLDQISGEYHSPSNKDSLQKLQHDLFYIKNRSIYLDLSIILKTIAIIFSRKGI